MEAQHGIATTRLMRDFENMFGPSAASPLVAAAPARVNLVGEHIDYNGGQVLPAAINRYLYVLARPRTDSRLVYRSTSMPGLYSTTLEAIGDEPRTGTQGDWSVYLDGMIAVLRAGGMNPQFGLDVLIHSDIPAGSGLSSSAALEVGFGTALCSMFSFDIDPINLALAAQQAEHRWAKVHCGIMDQFSVALGQSGHALLLDTASLAYRSVPLNLENYSLVVMNTCKPRQLAESKYNERHAECIAALKVIKTRFAVEHLCALEPAQLDDALKLLTDETLRRRVRHCVTENERVKRSAALLSNGDLTGFGALLVQSHESLRSNYEVTGAELDSICAAANDHPAALGARMTGAGFAGCAIALVKSDSLEDFTRTVGSAYTRDTGYTADFFACNASAGAMVVYRPEETR